MCFTEHSVEYNNTELYLPVQCRIYTPKQCCIMYISQQSLLWQLRGVMSSLRIWRPRPQTQPFKRNFYSHQTFLTSQSSTSEKKFFSYKLYTKTQSRPPFSFHSRPVFPFKLGNGSFIRTLNFSPGHL